MKEAIQKYQCKTCGQKTEYMEQKLTKVTKFSKHQEIKALLKKQKQFDTDESDFSDDISQDDNDCDSDYVPETPQNTGRKSIIQKKMPPKMTPHKKTHSKSRPLPFPKAQSKLSPKKKKEHLETARREEEEREDREESCNENEITTVLKVTAKKGWQGTENYFPKNKGFRNYVPEIFDDPEKEIWHKLIAKRERGDRERTR